jgi:hypothetical protein
MLTLIHSMLLGMLLLGAVTSKPLKLIVKPVNQKVFISLVNTGNSPIVVNRRFVINPLLGELKFKITNDSGAHQLAVMQNVLPPTDSDFIVLRPGDLVGRMMSLDMIYWSYNLKNGCYNIRAIYEYKLKENSAAYRDPVISNETHVCFSNTKNVEN